MKHRTVVASLFNGKMTQETKAKAPEKLNFVICCEFGDWSGFRTLAQCEQQYAELEGKGKRDGYYWVEER